MKVVYCKLKENLSRLSMKFKSFFRYFNDTREIALRPVAVITKIVMVL